MGYYCTVPQCTSLAGKTKNVKFHRFPRDVTMADKWNTILRRGKPYTKYSKVCSLHFTQADYNVTTMGQWKTLSKDAVPSQNLPKLNPDGTVMVIRKSRTVKYREGGKKEEGSSCSDKSEKWSPISTNQRPISELPESLSSHDLNLSFRLKSLNTLNSLSNTTPNVQNTQNQIQSSQQKPKKQDAFMQTDPLLEDEDMDMNYSETSEKSYNSNSDTLEYPANYQKTDNANSVYQKTDNANSVYQKTDNANSVYQKTDNTNSVYQKTDNIDSVYRKTDNTNSIYQKTEDTYQMQDAQAGYQKPDISASVYRENEVVNYHKPDNSATDYIKQNDYQKTDNYQGTENYQKDSFETPKDYTKSNDDYLPQTNEEYNKEAEKYALERKTRYEKPILSENRGSVLSESYDKPAMSYPKHVIDNSYQKLPDVYGFNEKEYARDFIYGNNVYQDSVEILRNQQQNLQMLQEQHRLNENQNFFDESHIKQEAPEDEKFLYDRSKDPLETPSMYESRRILDHLHHQVKQEPESSAHEGIMQPQSSPYFVGGQNNIAEGYYSQLARPGPELLIAKQNALAAHTQLWQNMKRPFYYTDGTHYNTALNRYEDMTRLLQ